MVHEMKIPSPGESITEVEISQWLVSDGDIVSKDQTIAELDSDKATLDLPAETSGKISLKAEEGDTMSVGEVICLIDTSFASEINLDKGNKEESTSNVVKEETIKSNPEEVTATPLAKNIAKQAGVN
ncbi:MAG: biotin/lipoyl-containing protein, partial [Candidatus Marisimplicoccus sp.]